MTSTSIATTDLTTDSRDDGDHAPSVSLDPTSGRSADHRTRRTTVAVLAGSLVVVAITAWVANRVHQPEPQLATSGISTTTVTDAAESAHGTRAGLATGTGRQLIGPAQLAAAPGSDRDQIAHGAAGYVVAGR